MADVNATLIPAAGLVVTPLTAASAGGDRVETGPNRMLLVHNTSAGAITATIVTPGTVGGLAIADNAFAVPAGAIGLVKLDPAPYRDTDGRAQVNWSATAGVAFKVIEPTA